MEQEPIATITEIPMAEILTRPNLYIVYRHDIPQYPNRPVWVGNCKIVDLSRPTDAMRSKEWRELMVTQWRVKLTILSVHDQGIHAMRECNRKTSELHPLIIPVGTSASNGRVMCNETGVIYETAGQACAELGIAPSNMSAHLKGRRSGKLVGLTFRYV